MPTKRLFNNKQTQKKKPRSPSYLGPWQFFMLCILISVLQVFLQIMNSSSSSPALGQGMIPDRLQFQAACDNTKSLSLNTTSASTTATDALQVSLLNVDKSQRPPLKTVVVYVCGGGPYAEAVLDSIHSLRQDGGYQGDIVVIFNARTKKNGQYDNDKEAEAILKEFQTMSPRVTVYQDYELLKDIVQDYPHLDYLQKFPSVPNCVKGPRGRKNSHHAKYAKLLIYHPKIAIPYDRVLYLDACMSYMKPHIDDLFTMPEVQGRIVAMPDPWIWRKKHISSAVNKCAPQEAMDMLHKWLGNVPGHPKKKKLNELGYLNSALMLYDTQIVKNYKTTTIPTEAATLLEVLQTFHTLTKVFSGGDQVIQTIYWVHIRELYAAMPMTMVDTDLVPFEFAVRLKDDPHIIIGANGKRPVCKRRATTNYQLSTATRLMNGNKTETKEGTTEEA